MKTKILYIILTLLLVPVCLLGQTVKIGDILCTDGSTCSPEQFPSSGRTAEGVVFFVNENGQGWAVSLECQAVNTHWVTYDHYYDMYDIPELDNFEHSREAILDLDGYTNTAIIRNTHGADWYPAAWGVDFNNGWYLPAAGQLRWLMAYINEINTSLAIVNGTTFVFDNPRWYWTSTERTRAHAVVVSQTGSVANYPKYNYINEYEIGVRAVKSFTVQAQTPTIGEIVTTQGGQRGVVFYVDPDNGAYWLAAMNDLSSTYQWGVANDIQDLDNYNENDQFVVLHGVHCGYDATLSIRDASGTASQYASSHVNLENGWHIPSAGQLSKLFAALPFIEDAFTDNGGSPPNSSFYWTSTECSSGKAWAISFAPSSYTAGIFTARDKTETYAVRPVWSPSCENIILPTVGSITAPEAICADESLTLQIPEVEFADAQGWQLSATADFTDPIAYDGEPLGAEYNGWFLRYFVTNAFGTVYSNTVSVIVWPTYATSFEASACVSYQWNGNTYDETGDYTLNLTSTHGCDSIVTLHLTISDILTTEFERTRCNSYTWNGITYSESGDYEQEFTTIEGCDSIVTLHLTITGPIYHEWSIEACDRYKWNDITYTEPGDYVQEFVTLQECDSIVTLYLAFSDALEVDVDTTACDSYSWNGNLYIQSGIYDSLFVTSGGCDSLVHLHLIVEPSPEAVGAIEGPTEVYVSTDLILGQYFYSIDSVGFADHYEWTLENADWLMDTTGLNCALWVTTAGDAILRVKAWNGCGFTEREILIHAGFYDIGEQAFPIALYPNPAHDEVFIEAEGIRHVKIYNMKGQCVIERNVDACDRLVLPLQGLGAGLYLIEAQTDLGLARVKLNISKL